jgi:hypothetical protein
MRTSVSARSTACSSTAKPTAFHRMALVRLSRRDEGEVGSRETERHRGTHSERECGCVCVCVCEGSVVVHESNWLGALGGSRLSLLKPLPPQAIPFSLSLMAAPMDVLAAAVVGQQVCVCVCVCAF